MHKLRAVFMAFFVSCCCTLFVGNAIAFPSGSIYVVDKCDGDTGTRFADYGTINTLCAGRNKGYTYSDGYLGACDSGSVGEAKSATGYSGTFTACGIYNIYAGSGTSYTKYENYVVCFISGQPVCTDYRTAMNTCHSDYLGSKPSVGDLYVHYQSTYSFDSSHAGGHAWGVKTLAEPPMITCCNSGNCVGRTGSWSDSSNAGCETGNIKYWCSVSGECSSSATGSAGAGGTGSGQSRCKAGYYTDGSSGTLNYLGGCPSLNCQRCPYIYGDSYAGTSEPGSVGMGSCYQSTGRGWHDDTGSWVFAQECPACTTTTCRSATDCLAQNYTTCNEYGCCSGSCSSGYTCSTNSDCQSHNYVTCSGNCCITPCSSGKYGTSTLQCQNQNYGYSENGCCQNSCGTKGTCSFDSNCYSNGYKTCLRGCCSGTQCASGRACSTSSDCPTAYPTCSSGCCIANSGTNCTYGSCTSDDDCLNSTCNLSTNCCKKPTAQSCFAAVNNCNTAADCYGGNAHTTDCICTCTNNRCSCGEGFTPRDDTM